MPFPVEVTFRHVDPSDALRQNIEEHAAKLERFANHILACHVTVEADEHRHQHGNRYRVHVHLNVAGGTLDAGKTTPKDQSHEDPYVAVRDTFHAMKRVLESFVEKQRGDVKRHVTPS